MKMLCKKTGTFIISLFLLLLLGFGLAACGETTPTTSPGAPAAQITPIPTPTQLLPTASPTLPATTPADKTLTVKGTILSLASNNTNFMFAEDAPHQVSVKISIRIGPDTKIYRLQGQQPLLVPSSELKAGQKLEVTLLSTMNLSYPPMTGATKIVILSDAN